MSDALHTRSRLGRFVNELEETFIALILGAMTVITFINVVLRYGYNSGLIWGLEATTILFAWLVLFGISYAVKTTAHLGVDAITNAMPDGARKLVTLAAALICIIYAFLLLKGAWDYWANFANLPQTTGRWFPTGFEEMKRTSYRGWYALVDTPMPDWLRWIEPALNEGEAYEKLPRFIPYFILPFGMALLLFRFVQAFVRLATGKSESLIVSHEAEDQVDEVRSLNEGD
ncbi:TRAP transporter small permease [Vannielia sp.]|uniref:TRAP transporter small permease n=1 Tax=Vannielia sp. TaxID=2813045 RepID=UPI002627833A|nr:TRAP transporter small permease [Vannielia sp.]MDF1873085.1 TRAP transporter small permease [Vannielia sp.]